MSQSVRNSRGSGSPRSTARRNRRRASSARSACSSQRASPSRSAPWRSAASSGRAERERHDGGQAGQRENIERVVVEDGDQPEGLLRAQEFEVAVGNHLAGQVALALHAQNAVLEVHQAAAFEAQFPEAARAEEQVEMLHAVERMARARHAEARFEQRLVVGLAVVGDEHVELREVLGQPPEQRRLLAVIAHEELAQAKARRLDGADPDEERVGAGAARQAGGFGVEKGPLEWDATRAMAPSESESSRSSGSSARSEISTLPWRRWRSQSLSVSKCSPCGVRTTSPLMSS